MFPPEKTVPPEKSRPFPVHRALHVLLTHLGIGHPDKAKEAKLLQEELDNAYSVQQQQAEEQRAETEQLHNKVQELQEQVELQKRYLDPPTPIDSGRNENSEEQAQ